MIWYVILYICLIVCNPISDLFCKEELILGEAKAVTDTGFTCQLNQILDKQLTKQLFIWQVLFQLSLILRNNYSIIHHIVKEKNPI